MKKEKQEKREKAEEDEEKSKEPVGAKPEAKGTRMTPKKPTSYLSAKFGEKKGSRSPNPRHSPRFAKPSPSTRFKPLRKDSK